MGKAFTEKLRFGNRSEDVFKREEGHRIVLGLDGSRLKPLGAGVVEGDFLAAVRGALEITAPQRRNQRKADDILAARQTVGGGWQDEFRLAVGTVLRQTRNGVADLRIEETPLDQRE